MVESTQDRVVNAAIKVISEKGFAAAKTKEIAMEAGVAEGTIFHYFKTKQDILFHIVSTVVPKLGVKTLADVINSNGNLSQEEQLKIIIDNRMKILVDNHNIIKIIITESQYHEELRTAYMENVVIPIIDILKHYIQVGIAKGEFRTVDIDTAAGMIMATFFMHAVNILTEGKPTLSLDASVKILLHGLERKDEK